jgi:hypothetical protein
LFRRRTEKRRDWSRDEQRPGYQETWSCPIALVVFEIVKNLEIGACLGQWSLVSNLYWGEIILQYKISHFSLMVFVNSRVWRFWGDMTMDCSKGLGWFWPIFCGLETECKKLRWGPKVQYWDNFMGLKVQNQYKSCGT